MKVKLLKPWGMHPQGGVLTVDPPIAEQLIQSGRAEALKETGPQKAPLKKQPWVK